MIRQVRWMDFPSRPDPLEDQRQELGRLADRVVRHLADLVEQTANDPQLLLRGRLVRTELRLDRFDKRVRELTGK
ncbi:MAG: hypothetical protein ACO3IB_11615 [Phycisphaerales bacterium]